MLQPFISVKWIDNIKQNVLKIVTTIPHQYSFTHLPGNDHLAFTNKTNPALKGITNALPEQNKNDDMILQDLFGAINY